MKKDKELMKFLSGVDTKQVTIDELREEALRHYDSMVCRAGMSYMSFIEAAIKAYDPTQVGESLFGDEYCIKTFSGRYVNVFSPDPDDIVIEDIAHGLSMMCRFGGQMPDFYSVAQHSCMVADLCWGMDKLAGLLHDASEAYMLDIPSPIKKGLPDYKRVEKNLMRVIAEKFGFDYPLPPSVKNADHHMLITEMNGLIRKTKPFPQAVHGQLWAEKKFLQYYQNITR